MNKDYEQELKVQDNKDYINNSTSKMIEAGNKIIQNTVQNKVNSLRSTLNKIPQIYQNMKNNLTYSNNKEIKRMNENIANTGNHTAGGYAISKRFDNLNNYNKQLSDIDNKKNEAILDTKDKIRNAYYEGEIEKNKLDKEVEEKRLGLYLDESKRQDDYKLDIAKFNETKRVNDADIVKINNDIMLDNKKDAREDDMHLLNLKYLPMEKEANLKNADLKADLTMAQIEKTMKEAQNVSSKTKSSGSGNVASKNDLLKMSAKDISETIKNQLATSVKESGGIKKVVFSPLEAYKLLMAWKKKYNLPDYKVNEAAIHLGIQDYI